MMGNKFTCLVLNLGILLTLMSSSGSLATICQEDICHYDFVIERRLTMTYTVEGGPTYNVEMNETAGKLQVVPNSYHVSGSPIGEFLEPEDVITADGVRRDIIVINGKFPGPTIEVREGAQIAVTVSNMLNSEGITIHWHGMHMKNNLWMDGTSYVTQCPIQPRQTFTYRLIADPPGTHWYHAHLASQRMDGLYGLLIVHKMEPVLPSHHMIVTDWYHVNAETFLVTNPHITGGNGDQASIGFQRDYSIDNHELNAMYYVSTLISGRGRTNYTSQSLPLKTFQVTHGNRYRFRIVNTGAQFSYEITIDEHKLSVIASDGHDLERVEVDAVMIHPSESVDFEVEADRQSGHYWIRANIPRHGHGPSPVADGVIKGGKAILSYIGNEFDITAVSSTKRICTKENICTVFNCPFRGYPAYMHKRCITFDDVTSTYAQNWYNEMYGTMEEDVEEMFLNFGYHQVGSSVNAHKFVKPKAPLIGNFDEYITPCDENACETGCRCTHIKEIPYNKTIQIVLTNYRYGHLGPHTIHFHGHSFAVLKMGFPDYSNDTGYWVQANGDVSCDTQEICGHTHWTDDQEPVLNTINPPIKDSIILPARGYVVLRFRSLNPGFWFLHCHLDSHMQEGMGILLNIGKGLHPPVPEGFPQCETFEWDSQSFMDNLRRTENEQVTEIVTQPNPMESSCNISVIKALLENNDKEKTENTVNTQANVLIGAAIGLVVLGAVVALLSILCYAQCFAGRKVKKELALS